MLLYALKDVVIFLVQGRIFLKGPIPLFLSVSALGELLLRVSRHDVYNSGAQVMVVNDPESQAYDALQIGRASYASRI